MEGGARWLGLAEQTVHSPVLKGPSPQPPAPNLQEWQVGGATERHRLPLGEPRAKM